MVSITSERRAMSDLHPAGGRRFSPRNTTYGARPGPTCGDGLGAQDQLRTPPAVPRPETPRTVTAVSRATEVVRVVARPLREGRGGTAEHPAYGVGGRRQALRGGRDELLDGLDRRRVGRAREPPSRLVLRHLLDPDVHTGRGADQLDLTALGHRLRTGHHGLGRTTGTSKGRDRDGRDVAFVDGRGHGLGTDEAYEALGSDRAGPVERVARQ